MPALLQINSTANTGSTGRIAAQIGDLAIQKGWDSWIAYGRSARECSSSLYRIDSKLEYLWHGAMTMLFDRHCFASTNATKRLIRFIQNLKPDVIHLHNLHGYYINIEVLFDFLSKADIPVIWTLHDCWAYTGHCSYYSNINCQKWQKQCRKCPKRGNYPKSLALDCSKRNYLLKKKLFNSVPNLTLVPVSHWLGNEAKKSFLSKNNIYVIPNGVDTEVFRHIENTNDIRKKFGIEKEHVLVGVATAWGPHKGWTDYIKLSELIPDNCQIVMVGVPDKKKSELPSGIITIPRTESQQELAELYSCADIVLNLSTQESFGLTTVEGMACGTPSIVYDCTASPELITQDTGRIVNKNDVQGVLSAIKTLISESKANMISSCRNRAVECFDKTKNYSSYIKLYDRLLNKSEI